ncbi:MAG: hypothetical protein N2484_15645 [Clostridia bacterium]|nr:hypothetical protein [Clostridia bacterium]
MNPLFIPAALDEKTLAEYDVSALRALIAENSKQIDRYIDQLESLKQKLSENP